MTVKLDLAYAVSANLVLPPVIGITLCRWTGGKYWLILVMLVAYPSIGRLFRGNPKNAGALYILASALLVGKQLALSFPVFPKSVLILYEGSIVVAWIGVGVALWGARRGRS